MPTPTRKGIFIVLLAMVLVVGVAVVPDIISEDLRAWCLSTFGEGYQKYLLGFFVVGSVVLLFLTTDIAQHLRPGAGNTPPDRSPGTPDPELVAKVRKYLTERYEHRLGQKMAGRQPVNLKILPSTTGTSQEGAENYITLQEEEVRAAIGDIFTRANGRLLLVGLPGSGKTTLVLQLALHLLERPGSSMPVVLNLATWRSEFKTLDEWLSKILPTELGATSSLAEQIRKNTPLVLLLDGLDELPEADRNSCLTAIGEYGADAGRQFLISSRIAEYSATKDAPVNAQIEVAPLTVEQVEIGLAATANIQPESRRLLNALKNDPLLRQAVENPFYLNTAQLLFSTGKNWSEFGFTATDVTGRQRELVDRFVESAMERKVKEEYPADKARHWLSFLASRMTERNMVVFELRDLQYDWWKWEGIPLYLAASISALVMGLPIWLIFGLTVGFFPGILTGQYNSWLLFGLLTWLGIWLLTGVLVFLITWIGKTTNHKERIITKDGIKWSWINAITPLAEFPFIWKVFGGLSWLLLCFYFGLIKLLLIGLFFVILIAFTSYVSGNHVWLLQINSPYHRFIASARNLHFSILEHLYLRWILHKQGLLPFRLVTFLNELSARHILEFDGDPHTGKGGGAWRFRHRILQNYFTAKYFADNASQGTLEELVEGHLHDDTWKEIFLLVAGMLPNADELLLLMLKKNREMLQEPLLNNFIDLSEKALLTQKSEYSNEGRKSMTIFIMLDGAFALTLRGDIYCARAYAIDLAHDLGVGESLSLGRTLEIKMARELEFDYDVALKYGFKLNRDHDDYLINCGLHNSELTIEKTSTFLRTNILIAQCLSSAAYLTKSTREHVLSMLLAPLTEDEKVAMGIKDKE